MIFFFQILTVNSMLKKKFQADLTTSVTQGSDLKKKKNKKCIIPYNLIQTLNTLFYKK